MVELIEQSQVAVDELIDVLGRASIEAVRRPAYGRAWPGRRKILKKRFAEVLGI